MRRWLPVAAAVVACSALACDRGQREPADEPKREIPEPEETDAPDPKQHMQEHREAGESARDAIIAGSPARAREPLSWLASHIYPDTLPGALQPHAQQMQAIARDALKADQLPQAANAIGRLAASCGVCHAKVDGGPQKEPSGFEVSVDNDLPERMHRHAWALSRMWDGLITPWDESWTVGAQVLSEGRLAALSQPESYSQAVRKELEEVRVLGRKALRSNDWQDRASVYGELLNTCASCHRKLAVKLE